MRGGIEELEINIQEPDELARVQALLPIMNVIFNKVLDSLSKSDQIKFRKKYHPFMTFNRSPLPLESVEILINAHKKGTLVMPTQVEDIVDYSGEFHLKTFKESKDEFGGFDYIISIISD